MDITSLHETVQQLKKLHINCYNKDFLLTWERTDNELKATVLLAEIFKKMHQEGRSYKIFQHGLAISIFRDHSTRTRFSFASAINSLGLALSELDEFKTQIAHGETVRETANMISFMTEVIGIRDDMYLGAGDTYMRAVSSAVQEGYEQGVLHQRPTVINLQSDIDHPTQSLSDLTKLKHHFGSFERLIGKKVAITWAYSPSYGKPLSVPQGLVGLMTRLGMHVCLAFPPGYNLMPEVIELAQKNARQSGGTFEILSDMKQAFQDAHIVYPKSWAPYSIMQKRTELLKNKEMDGLNKLENECLLTNAKHVDWECNDNIMKLTHEENALYMHCLPADISGISCQSGEVSKNIFEKYRIHTYQQASFKPFIIAAMIYLARVKNPWNKLEMLLN